MQKAKSGYKLVKSLFGKYEEIPEEWELKKIKDLAEINPEQIKNDYKYGEIEYVDISSIDGFQITKLDKYQISERPSRAQRIVKNNDIIISTVRPYLKSFSLINFGIHNLVCSTGFAVVRSKIISDTNFLFNYFKSHIFELNYFRQMEGMAYPAITSSVVSDSLIPTPNNKQERERIGNILSNIDNLIDSLEKTIQTTKKLKTGLMQTLLTKGIDHKKFKRIKWLFGKEIDIPGDWQVVELEQISKIIDSLHSTPKYSDSGIPIIRSTEIKHGDLKLENAPKVSKKVYNIFIKNYKPQRNDIVMSRVGTYFVTSFVNTDELFCIGQNTLVIHPLINSFFLYFALNSVFVNQQIEFLYDRTSGQKTLSLENIKKLKITLPTSLEQEKISSLLRTMDSKIYDLYSKKSILEKIKKGLMQKLLTGQIRVKV